jgi:transposase
MANQLKMALIEAVLRLHAQGWSQRRIARELGIDRAAVARHIHQAAGSKSAVTGHLAVAVQAESKPARAPTGSAEILAESKPARAPTGSSEGCATSEQPSEQPGVAPVAPAGTVSACAVWREVIEAKLDLGLSAQRIHQDLFSEHGFKGSYYSVRRFVHRLGHTTALPFRRLECLPGEEAQIDFGKGAPVTDTAGKRRRPHVLRVVLCHSRKGYSEAVYRQTTEDLIRCLEHAFCAFGGVPRRLVTDNLRAAVTRADWFDPEINPKMRSFCQHYGVVLLPTRPYTPRHKGKVERGVDYVQDNALKGRTFPSLEEENRFLSDWERSVADTRVHGTTRQQVSKLFAEVERPALQALPTERFPFFHEGQRRVHRDGHVEVDKAYYSVPPEYLTRPVWVRWDARVVRVFNQRLEQIALHVKREPGRFSTQGQHIVAEKISGVERGAAWLLGQTRRLGPHSTRWSEAVIAVRGIEGVRVLQGLLSLAHRHPGANLERACELAAASGAYHLRTIRTLLQRHADEQEQFDFMTKHPLIRDLADYGQFVHTSFQKELCHE